MAKLRLASRDTKDLSLGDDDFLKVRIDLSKSDYKKILSRLPEDFGGENATFNPLEIDDFTIGIFDAFVVGWSVTDESGKPIESTVENYLELSRDSATAIDTALFEHFNSLDLTGSEKTKSRKTS